MEKYRIYNHKEMGYAVFSAAYYPSGDVAFWQQVSNWYVSKGWAIRKLNQLLEKEDI